MKYESRYPLVRSGGLFLVLIGLGLLGGTLFHGDSLVNYSVFYLGLGLATISLFFSRRLASGRPSRLQLVALALGIALEMVLFVSINRSLPHGTPEQVRWLWAFIIVGVHFIPLAVAFGPRLVLLGFICIANGAAGLLLGNIPFDFSAILDGLLKVGLGVWLLAGTRATRGGSLLPGPSHNA
jgi:hypothetical protein